VTRGRAAVHSEQHRTGADWRYPGLDYRGVVLVYPADHQEQERADQGAGEGPRLLPGPCHGRVGRE
jgi:hypothetical protein